MGWSSPRTLRAGTLVAAAVAAVVAVVSVVVLLSGVGGTGFQTAYSDLVQLFAAAAACSTAALAAVRTSGRTRWSWAALAAGSGSWAAGEAVWSWYTLRLGVQTPFPSLADVGFLGFPLGAAVGLLLRPSPGSTGDRSRRVLDAALATAALTMVSWQTVLGAVLRAGGSDLEVAVSLAYPISDVLLLVLVVLTLSRSRSRAALGLAAAGMASLSVSDSAFAYLTATGAYNGGVLDLGWIIGFLLLALAPLVERDVVEDLRSGPSVVYGASLYPYVPVVSAAGVTLALALSGRTITTGQLYMGSGIVGLMLFRQYLTLRENAALTGQLAEREAELRHLAFHDPLTGLPNRALFSDRLGHALELHARDLRPVSLIFLDLDDFKVINDSLGHAAGDELLIRVGERLTSTLRRGDTVARLGGDEFAVLLEDDGDVLAVTDAVTAALTAPFSLHGSAVRVAASIGVVELPSEAVGTTADELLNKADTAMYAAKREGKGRLVVFQEGMALEECRDHRMAPALRAALAQGEVRLHLQPVQVLQTGEVHSVEALARWTWDGEAVPPVTFVEVAERNGLIDDLTTSVLDQACRLVAQWCLVLPSVPAISVNVSPTQLGGAAFLNQVLGALARHDVPASLLVLEITERAVVRDPEGAATNIALLRTAGVRIALADVGAGSSTLAQLHAIDLDLIKVDRSLVERLDSEPRQVRLLRSLLTLAEDMDLDVVVEGVERASQRDVLDGLGARLAQGYLFAQPMAPERLLALLALPRQVPGPIVRVGLKRPACRSMDLT